MSKVALFTDSDAFAGTERHMLELARGLAIEGVPVSLACSPGSPLAERAANEKLPIIAVEKRGGIDLRAVNALAAVLADGRIDVIHSHNGRCAFHAALAVKRAGRGSAVATQHFIDPARTLRRGPAGMLSRALHRWIASRTAHFIAVSEAAREAMIARGEAAAKISVVPNGISEPDVSKIEPPESIRQSFGLKPGVPLVVCVARLEPEKDVPTLVRAMSLLAEKVPDAVCVIAGEGLLAARLAAEISGAHLEKRVILAGFRSDALALIRAGDLFVLPSLAEPFGLVLLEAMALSRAVVATRAGGPVEIVDDGITGRLVPPQDPAAMAQAIGELLSSPETLREMGTRGAARFREKFTTTQMARATRQIYERVSGR
jgi:glycosyltransferase involved in cell wall biosynthesis